MIGIPHEAWGEQVLAVVVLEPGRTATAEEIMEHCPRDRSRATRCRRSIEFRTEPIPLSGALKPLKRELRAKYWEGKERAVD